jgi:hypothetical protein
MLYKESLLLRRGILIFVGIFLVLGIASDAGNHISHSRVLIRVPEILLFSTSWLAGIFSIVYGTSLGQESGEVARLALMRPISRVRAAALALAMGAASVIIVFTLGTGAFFLPYLISNGFNAFTGFTSWNHYPIHPWLAYLLPLAFSLAVYGLTAVVSVFSRRALVPALLVGPILIVIYLFNGLPGFAWLNAVNPLAIFIAGSNIAVAPSFATPPDYGTVGHLSPTGDAYVLACMFIVYGALAIVQWRRVEA